MEIAERFRVAVYPEEQDPLSCREPVVASVRASSAPAISVEPNPFQRDREIGARRFRVAVLGAVALLALAGFAEARAVTAIDHAPRDAFDAVQKSAGRLAFENSTDGDLLMLTSCPDEMGLAEHAGPHGENVCVDRWEGSIVQMTPAGKETPWSPYDAIPPGTAIKAVSRPGVVPQGYISKRQAEQACNAAGKRLCSSQEWVSACEGPDATLYPYGETEDSTACNTKGQNPLKQLFGSLRRAVYGLLPMNNPLLNKLPNTVAKTGSFTKCVNEYGLYDMVGNLHEWTAEDDGITGVFRGGYYLDTKINGRGCGYATTAHGTWYHDYSTGFRCCKDAE